MHALNGLMILQNMLESKKQFVRYISHEIRTPLNTVFMGIQLASKQLTQNNVEDVGSILHDVEESCVTAVDILNDILLYDKIEDGRMELDKSDISARNLVKSVADLFIVQVCAVYTCFKILVIGTGVILDVQARRSNVNFEVHCPSMLECASLHVDVNKCGQVLRNMVSNALKFTPAEGTVKLICKLLSPLGEPVDIAAEDFNPTDDVHFRFEVHDTGPGISVVRARHVACLLIKD
jgi:signal transduction histidine kinase